jgi:hypothetical protein
MSLEEVPLDEDELDGLVGSVEEPPAEPDEF